MLESTNDLGRTYAEQIHLKNLTVASPGSKTRNSVYFNHIYSEEPLKKGKYGAM